MAELRKPSDRDIVNWMKRKLGIVAEFVDAAVGKIESVVVSRQRPVQLPAKESVQISALASELDTWVADVIDFLPTIGITEKKSPASYVDVGTAEKVKTYFRFHDRIDRASVFRPDRERSRLNQDRPRPDVRNVQSQKPKPDVLFEDRSELRKSSEGAKTLFTDPGPKNFSKPSQHELKTDSGETPHPKTELVARFSNEGVAGRNSSKAEGERKRIRKWLAAFVPEFEFPEKAIERLQGYDDSIQMIFYKQLRLMDRGKLLPRCAIIGPDPTVYEIKAGFDYRIYYRPKGGSVFIILVGHKNDQATDCRLM